MLAMRRLERSGNRSRRSRVASPMRSILTTRMLVLVLAVLPLVVTACGKGGGGY